MSEAFHLRANDGAPALCNELAQTAPLRASGSGKTAALASIAALAKQQGLARVLIDMPALPAGGL